MSNDNPGDPYEAEKGTLTYIVSHLLYRFSRDYTKMLRGKLLTLTDATFADLQQRKAQKDLINQICDSLLFDDFNNIIGVVDNFLSKELNEDSTHGDKNEFLRSILPDQFEAMNSLKYIYSRKEK